MKQSDHPISERDAAPFRKFDHHRRWLAQLGILGRPWLILGGAPDPTLPTELLGTHARVDINNSGLTAQKLGLGIADLTFRRAKVKWAYWPEFATRGLIWFTATPSPLLWLSIRTKHRRARVASLMRMPKTDRNAIVERYLGADIHGVGDQGKPSNGVVAACYALAFDVPEIVLAGVSLVKQGHSYDTLGRPRKQVAEDAFAFERLVRDPRVSTTEPELADATGLRLWTPPDRTGPVVQHAARG